MFRLQWHEELNNISSKESEISKSEISFLDLLGRLALFVINSL